MPGGVTTVVRLLSERIAGQEGGKHRSHECRLRPTTDQIAACRQTSTVVQPNPPYASYRTKSVSALKQAGFNRQRRIVGGSNESHLTLHARQADSAAAWLGAGTGVIEWVAAMVRMCGPGLFRKVAGQKRCYKCQFRPPAYDFPTSRLC